MPSLHQRNHALNPPLTPEEGRSYDLVIGAATRTEHRVALSRFIADLTPTRARWLSELDVPEQMWKPPDHTP